MTQKFEMADRFNPSAVEQALYQHWEESGYFNTELLHCNSAAERNRFFAHGARFPTNLNGYLNPF